ncbi:MAG: hypothetical protein IH941_05355 [Acidobacteria bacterium]|nr:hypothetical protein [Acidobacteriota bacterium]
MYARRVVVVGWVAGLVLAMSIPAFAKGVYQVTLTGGGQEVTFNGSGEPNTNTILSNLSGSARFFDGLWTDDHLIPLPSGNLGPQIAAVWLFIGPNDDIPVVQHLYPFAEGGPVAHIPAGQVFINDSIREAWFPLGPDIGEDLAAVGFDLDALGSRTAATVEPPIVPLPVATAVREATSAAPVIEVLVTTRSDTGISAPGVLWLVAAAGTVLALSGIMRRHIRRRA